MKWYKYNIDEMSDSLYEKYLCMMSPQRQSRTERKTSPADRLLSVAGEMLVRRAVSELLGISEESVQLCSDKFGAPILAHSDLFVSISHSKKTAVCALSDTPVGIDIEKVRPISSRVACKTFSEKEKEYLDCNGELCGEALVRFYEIWTAKEAYAKMKGCGIMLSNTVDTTKISLDRAHFDGYVVSICTENP